MIAGRENVFARDVEQTSKLSERGAFVIIGVTESEEDGVALIIELRLFPARVFDELGDALHFFLARGDESRWALGFINDARFRFLIHKIDNLSEDGLRRGKKVGMSARTALVPIAERLPLFAI